MERYSNSLTNNPIQSIEMKNKTLELCNNINSKEEETKQTPKKIVKRFKKLSSQNSRMSSVRSRNLEKAEEKAHFTMTSSSSTPLFRDVSVNVKSHTFRYLGISCGKESSWRKSTWRTYQASAVLQLLNLLNNTEVSSTVVTHFRSRGSRTVRVWRFRV